MIFLLCKKWKCGQIEKFHLYCTAVSTLWLSSPSKKLSIEKFASPWLAGFVEANYPCFNKMLAMTTFLLPLQQTQYAPEEPTNVQDA